MKNMNRKLALHGIENASAPDLLAEGRPLTNAEATTGHWIGSKACRPGQKTTINSFFTNMYIYDILNIIKK